MRSSWPWEMPVVKSMFEGFLGGVVGTWRRTERGAGLGAKRVCGTVRRW